MPIETLNLSANYGMVDISKKDKPSMPPPEPGFKEPPNSEYDNQRENMEKNNVDKEQMMELATPLDEIMDAPPQAQQQMVAPPQPTMMAPQAPMMAQPEPQQAAPPKAQNPGGLTNDQMDELMAAAAAVKDQIGKYVPQLFDEQGARTLAGTVATGLVAAGAFYGVKKFVLNK